MPEERKAVLLSQYFCRALGNILGKRICLVAFNPMYGCCKMLPETSSYSLPELSHSSPARARSLLQALLLASVSVLPWLPTHHPFGIVNVHPKPHKLLGDTG